jgi:polygalacturonase
MRSHYLLLASATLALARPPPSPRASDCTGTISSISDVTAAVACTAITINAFTVPAGETFTLALLQGTTVTMGKECLLPCYGVG